MVFLRLDTLWFANETAPSFDAPLVGPHSRTMTATVKGLLAGEFRQAPVAMTVVRVGLGLMWISNLAWKVPPEFGRGTKGGLYSYLADAVAHPVFPPYSWLVEHAVIPAFLPFAWMTIAVETLLAVLLLTGTWTRFAALLGIAQSLAIGLSVAVTPNEWPWSYALMMLGHLAILASSPAAQPGVDKILYGSGNRTMAAGRQLTGWGAVAIVAGLWAAATSFGDPLASGGTTVGLPELELQVGQYNLLGGLLLLLLGAALVVAARRRNASYTRIVAAVAAVAALSVVARWGFGSVPLGGNGSSTALFLAIALVALLMGRSIGRAPDGNLQEPTTERKDTAPATT